MQNYDFGDKIEDKFQLHHGMVTAEIWHKIFACWERVK